jgi:hypothetical protein
MVLKNRQLTSPRELRPHFVVITNIEILSEISILFYVEGVTIDKKYLDNEI